MNRRQFICTTGVAVSLAGCLGSDDSVKDSDGDGVIDSQDYAPQDSAVQDKSDIRQTTREEADFDFDTETTQEPDTTTESEFDFDDVETAEELPNPEIQRLLSSEPKLVSIDHSSQSGADEFTAAVQNEGDNGQVHVSLYWGTEKADNNPDMAAAEKSVFFSSGERRTVALYADPPSDADEYEIRARTATRGAEIENRGVGGNVNVELKGGELAGSEVLLDSQTLFIGENRTETVTFDGTHPLFGDDWKIEASPADNQS